jgi:pimeloyl-CoA dehydrogenase small subunit
MDFDLTDDQRLLQESVTKMLASAYGDFTHRRTYQDQPDGFDRRIWQEYAQSGLLSLTVPEQYGGLGQGAVETLIVMEAFGAVLALEPFLTSSVLGAALVRHGGSEALQAAVLPRVADGTAILALAQVERNSRDDLGFVEFAAVEDAGHYVLNGDKSVALGGGAATHVIVSARTAGAPGDPQGITLFLVDAGSAGLTRRSYPTQDGMQAAEISFRDVRVPAAAALGIPGQGLALLTRGVDEAIAGLCAEAVGAMDALTAMTVEYLKTRRQFGVPIASFQALQHRAVDMRMALEQARSMAIYAALCVADGDEAARRWAVSAAKVQVGQAARFIGQQAVQLHGGIGMTMEYKAGHYFKRLTMIEQQFGDWRHHLRELAAPAG